MTRSIGLIVCGLSLLTNVLRASLPNPDSLYEGRGCSSCGRYSTVLRYSHGAFSGECRPWGRPFQEVVVHLNGGQTNLPRVVIEQSITPGTLVPSGKAHVGQKRTRKQPPHRNGDQRKKQRYSPLHSSNRKLNKTCESKGTGEIPEHERTQAVDGILTLL